MKSTTKYRVTDEQIRSAFEAAGIGEVDQITELSDGWYNSVFSAADKRGKKYVIKIAPDKGVKVLTYEKGIMASEINFYELLKEKTTVKVPEIVFADFSERVMPTAYFIMGFLGGERLDKAKLTPLERQKAYAQTARILAEFHKVKGEGYGYPQVGLFDNWKDALTHMTKALIDDAASFGKKCKIANRLLQYIEKFSDTLKAVPSVFVNFDLNDMNVFCERTADGEIQLAVLDLERGFWGDPIGDFVTPEPLKPLAKMNILPKYNDYAAKKVVAADSEAEIRYSIMTAYLAAIMYVERFSRFKGAGKIFNPVYLMGTLGAKIFARQAFSALKRLSR